MEARDSFCFPKNTKNPNPSPIEKRFGFSLFGAMEEMRNETVRERNIEIAKTMLASKKLSYEDIALFSGLTVDEVKSLDSKKPA